LRGDAGQGAALRGFCGGAFRKGYRVSLAFYL
jgi:hypothetical protein